jgi:hypothetical protein
MVEFTLCWASVVNLALLQKYKNIFLLLVPTLVPIGYGLKLKVIKSNE